MAERLAEDLWRLDIPLVGNPLKNLNSYLLTGERSLLIDTGFRQQSCREAMERQLAETHVDRDRTGHFLHPPPQRPHRAGAGADPPRLPDLYRGDRQPRREKRLGCRPVGSGSVRRICAGRLHPGGDGGPVGRQSGPERRPRPGGKGSIRSCRTARRSITAAVCCGAC